MEYIEAGEHTYMSEFMTDLPENVMLNKVVTGCGGTTVALKNNVPYIILVPYRAMIINKMEWGKQNNKKLQPVMGGISDDEINNFTGNKYICTYDSIERIYNLFGSNKTKKFKVLVDESHILVTAGAYRGDAIRKVLKYYKMFRSFVFMTATRIKNEYQLPELKNLDQVEVKWKNLTPVRINYEVVDVKGIRTSIPRKLAVLALEHLNGTRQGNVHIFINSVNSIIDTIKFIDNTPGSKYGYKDVHIIVSDNDNNEKAISKKLNGRYCINDVGEVAKVNFYTSTAFEGSDIYDEDGIIYIAADGNKGTTKIDIYTTLPQIAGRIRNAKHQEINLIYCPDKYNYDVSEEEFSTSVKKSLQDARGIVYEYKNTKNLMLRSTLIKGADTNSYLTFDDLDRLIVNETAWYAEMSNYDAIHQQYYVNSSLSTEAEVRITANSIKYNYVSGDMGLDLTEVSKIKLGDKPNFAKACREYVQLAAAKSLAKFKNRPLMNVISDEFPMIKEGYNTLGASKLGTLKYRKGAIQQALILESDEKNKVKAKQLLNLPEGKWMSSNSIKKAIQEVFDKVGIKKKATANMVYLFYNVKPQKKWFGDESIGEQEVRINGALIISKK